MGVFSVLCGEKMLFLLLLDLDDIQKNLLIIMKNFHCVFLMKTIKKFCLIFGSHSGRYENKIKKSGLIPTFLDDIPCFYQSNLVLICKKLYKQDLTPSCFFNKDLDEKWYPLKDYHCMYVSEIEHVYTKEQKRTLITFVLIKTF